MKEVASHPGLAAHATRAAAIESLSNEVFGRGNQHLKNVETLTSLPEGLHSFPEVCFIGKPNCGKSSLISCLLHNKRLGKAGTIPGTTRLLQFFNVGDGLLLVDTPGYGGWKGRFVETRRAAKANAFSILFRYLALRNGCNLKRVYWLMEASATSPVRFQPRDEEILAFLMRERIPFSVVLTKIDRHWRLYADEQRRTAVTGKDGVVRPEHPTATHYVSSKDFSLPEDGVARNVREVFDFLGTDQVPILGVSANRQQPCRSRNIELLQHDIVHYCTQDLLPGEALTLRNLQKIGYAPPTADRVQDIQLRYPVESFVVPDDNNLSLADMVTQHEEAKARLLTHVSAARLSAKDVAACHLGSIDKLVDTAEQETDQRQVLCDVIAATTLLAEGPATTPAFPFVPAKDNSGFPEVLRGRRGSSMDAVVSLRHEARSTVKGTQQTTTPSSGASGRFHPRPSLAGPSSRFGVRPRVAWHDAVEMSEEDAKPREATDGTPETEPKMLDTVSFSPLSENASSFEGATPSVSYSKYADAYPMEAGDAKDALILREQPLQPLLELPSMLDLNANFVIAIDGTRIPRSMMATAVEQLAVSKEDELGHFATKSGAGAYEELLLVDQQGGEGADIFTEASSFARLPDAQQDRLLESRQCRTRSASRKQEERFLAKYVERRRKERSVYMHAEGYMCPWLGAQEKRHVVHGLGGSHTPGVSGAVLRGLKQKGFGGKSYSARTMKHRGRATTKTGSWAA